MNPSLHWFRWVGPATVIAIVAVGCSMNVGDSSRGAGGSDPAPADRGAVVYREHCASCHGFNLEGQPGWQMRNADGTLPAPPHDASGHTWHHSDQLLFDLTKLGPSEVIGNDYQSTMPGFSDVLHDDDIWAVLAYIESQWPEEIRAARNAR
ncbi:MAG: cytochrome c [Chloroflexi bacterium]|nr:cytochrome c [Chloroflexota bacterium]